MEWAKLVIGGRVRVRLPSGTPSGTVEVIGQLLGRDRAKFIERGRLQRDIPEDEFRALVRLDDGTVILAELDSIVGRAEG